VRAGDGTARRRRPVSLRRAATILLLALAAICAVGIWVGWGRGASSWAVATGWRALPESERLSAASLAGLDWGEAGAPRIDWLGHSGFVIRWSGTTLLLDPNTSGHCTISPRRLEPAADVAGLGPVDGVLISHAHYDHLDLPTLARLAGIGTVVLPRGSESYFSDPRWDDTVFAPLVPGESTRVGRLEIVAVPAVHNGSRFHPLRSARGALGYVVRNAGEAIYYSGDTGFDLDFLRLGLVHRPRIAILPIGAYAPRVPMKYYHLSPEEAVEAARRLGVQAVIPCHFGTFVLSLDRPASALPRFVKAAGARGVAWIMPTLLREEGRARAGSPPSPPSEVR
jgi:L-ascorbate metabolism protein UlaG (beta-lactamase superfamily)